MAAMVFSLERAPSWAMDPAWATIGPSWATALFLATPPASKAMVPSWAMALAGEMALFWA